MNYANRFWWKPVGARVCGYTNYVSWYVYLVWTALLLQSLGNYKYKKGPLGSSKPMEILDKQEIATILKRPRSKLGSMWKRDALMSWASSLNEPPKLYKPSEGAIARAAKVVLPGEKCDQCKIQRGKCQSVWVVLYYLSLAQYMQLRTCFYYYYICLCYQSHNCPIHLEFGWRSCSRSARSRKSNSRKWRDHRMV